MCIYFNLSEVCIDLVLYFEWIHERSKIFYRLFKLAELKLMSVFTEDVTVTCFVCIRVEIVLPMWCSGQENACQCRTCERHKFNLPGSGRSPGIRNGNPFQYCCLENPMDREAWQATVHGVAKSRTRLSAHTHHGRDRLGLLTLKLWPSTQLAFILMRWKQSVDNIILVIHSPAVPSLLLSAMQYLLSIPSLSCSRSECIQPRPQPKMCRETCPTESSYFNTPEFLFLFYSLSETTVLCLGSSSLHLG